MLVEKAGTGYKTFSELVAATKVIWGKKLRRDVSDDEARGIIRTFSNFLLVLKEIKCPTRQ